MGDGGGTGRGDDDGQRVRDALALLAEELRRRVERHPHGYLAAGSESLDLPLHLSLARDPARLAAAARELSDDLTRGLDGLLGHHAVLRPGHVFCLRCGTADCEHAALAAPRETFTGYGPTGLPRFQDFGQWLLASRDPRLDALYAAAGPTVAVIATPAELLQDLLPAYRDNATGFQLHGQVTAGWFRLPDAQGLLHPLAVTFQVVSSRPSRGRRRYGLGVLALAPGGETLERLADRAGELPWSASARWAQSVVAGFAPAGGSHEVPESRIEGLLAAVARRLEKGTRARDRRTHHAEERHQGGDRPTRMAITDLARARDESLLFDVRKKTFVVLGERGRAHVFSPAGKLVTSVRYPAGTTEKRRERGLWRPAAADEIRALREKVEGTQSAEGRG
jgi:hypothetical protein